VAENNGGDEEENVQANGEMRAQAGKCGQERTFSAVTYAASEARETAPRAQREEMVC